DGVNDNIEVEQGTRADSTDTDNDGLTDYQEIYNYSTDPLVADTDGDGMGDGFEIDNNMTSALPDGDEDSDGLSNIAEFQADTDPRDKDSDDDMLWDGWEVNTYNTNPNSKDSDGGGRWDIDELFTDGTDPNYAADERTLNSSSYHNLYDENNRYWRVEHPTTSGGRVGYTYPYASTNAFLLTVNGTAYRSDYHTSNYVGVSADGREYFHNAQSVGDLRISRRAFVPSTGGAFIRYMEIVSNPGAAPVDVTLQLQSWYAAGDANTALTTSSNDDLFTTDDESITLWDKTSSSRPVLSHLFAGPYR
ncbi:MAG: hypothetical protein GWO08_02080, partial [Gammaproteobacteria bacterium]|nr:hypothetical protein [Gammaproteobacteria bacterium]